MIIALILLGLTAICCVCAVSALAVGGFFTYRVVTSTEIAPLLTYEVPPLLTEFFATETPTPKPDIVLTPLPTPLPGAGDTLETLQNAVIPGSDLREIATRLQGIPDIPATVSDQPANHAAGDRVEFWVSNQDTHANLQITAVLIYATENVYFFAEEGVEVDRGEVEALVDHFQGETYPTNREFFGSEWNPGVDGDPHLYILYAHNLGSGVAGYYSSADEYSRLAHEYSNEKEMFYISAETTTPGDAYLASVLAHEFQHMIHWHSDINEETWMNEGSSVLAELLNGYGSAGFDTAFIIEPDLQLNTWTEDGSDYSAPHYGAGFLFMAYFLDRFGEEATQALVADPANGFRAVENALQAQGITDPATGQPVTAVDVFADWVIANYLGDPDVADGRYEYHLYPDAPTVERPTEAIDACPASDAVTVHQFAADYYEINCDGQITLEFSGSLQARVNPAMPHGGRYAFWSHRNDESDTYLTREFDLAGLNSATFRYWAWWAIETDYDYAYLEVSTDGGKTWKIVQTPSGTDYDPTGNSFGWGYTGDSGGGAPAEWVQEKVDLSEYAGKKILVRFEYVTDAAVNRPGFMVDDIEIPELDYAADFESDAGGWEGVGFVRIDNLLPQTFVVQVIEQGRQSQDTTVHHLTLDANNQGSLTLDLDRQEKAILVVSGATPFTTELASYQFEVKP